MLAGGQANASGITDEGAAKLKEMFKAPLIAQQEAIKEKGNAEMILDGEVMVEPNETYYAVTLPPISIVSKDGSHLDIGMISINTSPGKEDGTWKMSVALPTPIIAYDSDDTPLHRIDIGGQKASGTWNEALGFCQRVNAAYSDITITGENPGYEISIPALSISNNLSPDEEGRWSGPTDISATDITASFTETEAELGIKSAGMHIEVQRYAPDLGKKWRDEMIALSEEENPSPEDMKAVPLGLMDALFHSIDGYDSSYKISGISISIPETEEEPAQSISLGEAHAGMTIASILSGKAEFGLRGGASGFALSPEPEKAKQLLPDSVNVNLAAINLPVQDLLSFMKDNVGAGGEELNSKVALALPSLLSKNDSRIVIKDTYISRDDSFKTALEGHINADTEAANRVTADLKATIGGFDTIIDHLRARMKDGSAASVPVLTQIAMGLQVLKGMGKAEIGENEKIDYTYRLELDKAGTITLNDQDIGLLLKALTMGGKAMGGSSEVLTNTPE